MLNEKIESYRVVGGEDTFDKEVVLSVVAYNLNCIRNDLIYLHVNSFGMSFQDIHDKFDEYYKKITEDIDTVLEIIGIFSWEHVPVHINFNTFGDCGYESVGEEVFNSDRLLIDAGRTLLDRILSTLDILRLGLETSGNDALLSEVDDIAKYWIKQHAYILKRYLS